MRMPAKWMLHEQLPPQRYSINLLPIKVPGVETIGNKHTAFRINREDTHHSLQLRVRCHYQPLACTGPTAHALSPGLSIFPVDWWSLLDSLKHEQFCAMNMSNHSYMRRYRCRVFIERRDEIQMENIGFRSADTAQRSHRGHTKVLIPLIVDSSEDSIGPSGAIFVG